MDDWIRNSMKKNIFLCMALASVDIVFGYNPKPWDGASIVTVDTLASFISQVDVDTVQKVDAGIIMLPTGLVDIQSEALYDINQAFKGYVQEKLDASRQEFPEYLTTQDYYFYDTIRGQYNVPVWNDFDYTVGFLFGYLAYDVHVLQYESCKELLQRECAALLNMYDVWTIEKMDMQLIAWEEHIESLKQQQTFLTVGHEKELKKFLKIAHVFMFMQLVGSLQHADFEKDIMSMFAHRDEFIEALDIFGLWYLLIMY